MTRRKSTRTSAFGAPGRISPDTSHFYRGRLYAEEEAPPTAEYVENPVPPEYLDRLFTKSSESMAELPDCSVHLMVTSLPYNGRKEYDANPTLDEYRSRLRQVMAETYRVLVTAGRACVNVASLGRKPYIPLHAFLIRDMLGLGFRMRGEIICNEGGSASRSTAWGSWKSAANPVLRDVHEYILVFSKGSFSRPADGRQSTIAREDFLERTKSVWTFPAVSAHHVGHPAPFPEELPRRLIALYTFEGDVVLDPLCGSGTTCLAVRRAGRHYGGRETEPRYVRLAQSRLRSAAKES